VQATALYVSDNRGDQLYRVEPADFLNCKKETKVTFVFSGKSVNPSGLYPAKSGSVLMVGFKSDKEARGIHNRRSMTAVRLTLNRRLAASVSGLAGFPRWAIGQGA
jgi:hypothetical protein